MKKAGKNTHKKRKKHWDPPVLLIPLEHSCCWTIVQTVHLFLQEEPLVLTAPPVAVDLSQGDLSCIVKLPRKPQNGGEAGFVATAWNLPLDFMARYTRNTRVQSSKGHSQERRTNFKRRPHPAAARARTP